MSAAIRIRISGGPARVLVEQRDPAPRLSRARSASIGRSGISEITKVATVAAAIPKTIAAAPKPSAASPTPTATLSTA